MSAVPEQEGGGISRSGDGDIQGRGDGDGDVQGRGGEASSDDSSESSRLDAAEGWTKGPGERADADAGGAYATLTRYLRIKPGASSPRGKLKASTLGNYFRRKTDEGSAPGGDPSTPQRPGFWHWFGWAPKKLGPKVEGGARQ